ncbi:unnamed protein product [Acanthoscelides obtectus]|uniref:Uncharacterized protein n=1 Tax=Acanthoscelides obtectus TaxID=200917 RepID=A0A9P0JTJ5_ACAOB|nr:unnamed protein product [Acanthoscelides obtectus]CAK1633866.1 hypothetical protein AOBTE_LOCUS8448 [Acanthoscelides obtectus]
MFHIKSIFSCLLFCPHCKHNNIRKKCSLRLKELLLPSNLNYGK